MYTWSSIYFLKVRSHLVLTCAEYKYLWEPAQFFSGLSFPLSSRVRPCYSLGRSACPRQNFRGTSTDPCAATVLIKTIFDLLLTFYYNNYKPQQLQIALCTHKDFKHCSQATPELRLSLRPDRTVNLDLHFF